MATSTAVYSVSDRVVVTAATGGFAAGALGTCVGHYYSDASDAYVYVIRVLDDVDGTCDLHLLAAAITVAP